MKKKTERKVEVVELMEEIFTKFESLERNMDFCEFVSKEVNPTKIPEQTELNRTILNRPSKKTILYLVKRDMNPNTFNKKNINSFFKNNSELSIDNKKKIYYRLVYRNSCSILSAMFIYVIHELKKMGYDHCFMDDLQLKISDFDIHTIFFKPEYRHIVITRYVRGDFSHDFVSACEYSKDGDFIEHQFLVNGKICFDMSISQFGKPGNYGKNNHIGVFKNLQEYMKQFKETKYTGKEQLASHRAQYMKERVEKTNVFDAIKEILSKYEK